MNGKPIKPVLVNCRSINCLLSLGIWSALGCTRKIQGLLWLTVAFLSPPVWLRSGGTAATPCRFQGGPAAATDRGESALKEPWEGERSQCVSPSLAGDQRRIGSSYITTLKSLILLDAEVHLFPSICTTKRARDF